MNDIFFTEFRSDGIQNLTTGMGVPSYDPTLHAGIFSRRSLTREEQSQLLKHGFLRKIVSKLPKASTSKWGYPTIVNGDPETIQKISAAMDRIKVVVPGELPTTGVKNAFRQALFNAFLTGDGAIVIHTVESNKGSIDLAAPLDLKSVEEIRKLVVLDRWAISPLMPENMEEVTHFQVATGSFSTVHASRVLWFEGEKLDQWGKIQNQGCDESILDGIYEIFIQYAGGIQGAARMLQDFDVLDIGIEGLWELDDKAAEVVRQRSRQNTLMQSLYRARIRDSKRETITHTTRTVSGYADLLESLKSWMLANTDYPPAVLFGEFSSGLDASGKSQEEIDLWNETIADIQSSRMSHQLIGLHPDAPGLIDILCACKKGPTGGEAIEGLSWTWKPLYQASPTEQAQLELSRAQIATTIASMDPDFMPQYILSSYGEAEFSPNITFSPEYKQSLKERASLAAPPEQGDYLDQEQTQ